MSSKSSELEIIKSYNGIPGALCHYLRKNHPELYNKIEENAKFYTELNPQFMFKVAWYFYDISTYPICPICGKENHRLIANKTLSFLLIPENKKFLQYCSRHCLQIGEDTRGKIEKTCLERYGVTSVTKTQAVKDKARKTLIDHYGSDGLKSEAIREKKKQTNLERYGVEYNAQAKEVKDKIKKTFDEKYNGHPLRDKDVQEKFKNTCLQHFGVEHYMKTDEIKNKIKQTCMEKYGTDSVLKVDDVRERIKSTIKEKYGVDNVSQSEEIKNKKKESSLRKYGTEYAFQAKEVKEKIKETLLERYGVDNVSKNEDIHQRQTDSIIRKKRKQSYDTLIKNNDYVELLNSEEEYIEDIKQEFTWRCKKCGNIFTTKKDFNFVGIARCQKCYPKNYFGQEKEIYDFLSELIDCRIDRTTRCVIPPKELDIYIPDKKLAIEFNGLFWHSTQFNADPNYHLNKTKECEEKGIQLIHIFEDEWENKKDIVKDRLKSTLGIFDKTTYARKCQVKKINNNLEESEFLQNNHIQGPVNSLHCYGLYYDNELISIMSFGHYRNSMGRKSEDDEYEIYRCCNKLGYHIPGAASRILYHFINDIKPKKIISYCDRRWSQGKLYKSLGFNLISESVPNYYYVSDRIFARESRIKYQKSKLSSLLENYDPNLTEEENMKNNNYYKIYDCGSYLFTKIY